MLSSAVGERRGMIGIGRVGACGEEEEEEEERSLLVLRREGGFIKAG